MSESESPSQRKTRLSSGVVVIRSTPDGIKFLLLRAFTNWDFPKGMVEAGETPLQGALREVDEETAITDLAFHWGEEFIETGPYSKSKVARYYLAATDSESVTLRVNHALGRAEHNAYRWVSATEARSLLTPRVVAVLDWATAQLRNAGVNGI